MHHDDAAVGNRPPRESKPMTPKNGPWMRFLGSMGRHTEQESLEPPLRQRETRSGQVTRKH